MHVPAGAALEEIISLAELMQPASMPGEASEAESIDDDTKVLRLAQYLLSKVPQLYL